jgi:hypothetical protein
MHFTCATCGKEHDGIPSYGADRPAQWWHVPENRRERDVLLSTDSCIIADRFFFVHGCIELPVIGTDETFSWGVWVSLKKETFLIWQAHYDVAQRSHIGPFFGWLCTALPGYPDTLNLKTTVHVRDDGIRPFIELEPTDHPLAVEQRRGITMERIQEIIQQVEHSAVEQTNPADRKGGG